MVEQTQPQFIFWVKEIGVFRSAEPKLPEGYLGCEGYLGYDLEKNIELGEREISPQSLDLISSVYLGPVNIFEEDMGYFRSNESLERLKQHKHGTAHKLIRLAEDVAKEKGVPYFAVDVVQTFKDRTWKFDQKDDWLSGKVLKENEKYSSSMERDEPREPIEFVLHPTAQLYIPRKHEKIW